CIGDVDVDAHDDKGLAGGIALIDAAAANQPSAGRADPELDIVVDALVEGALQRRLHLDDVSSGDSVHDVLDAEGIGTVEAEHAAEDVVAGNLAGTQIPDPAAHTAGLEGQRVAPFLL